MPILRINRDMFCPNTQFLGQVVDILCNSYGIFDVSAKEPVKKIYDNMRQNININQYFIYSPCGILVQNGINDKLLKSNGRYYAGHDLPVWLNDPSEAKHRILVVSQDPRRNDQEMGNGTYEIGISTPFGLHSMQWRSNKTKGFVHWLFDKLLKECHDNMCVYYTDVYKFRGVGPKSVLDTPNFNIYKDILRQEIDLFKPNVVLLMGTEAQNTYKKAITTPAVIKAPHPNARVKDKKYWGEYEMNKFDTDSKIEKIINEIKQKLNIN